jgi:predicted amidohydrolase
MLFPSHDASGSQNGAGARPMTLPIACAQLASTPYEPRANLEKADQYIHDAARNGARLVLLPEFLTSNCTYSHRLHDMAEEIGGSTTRWMQQHSKHRRCWIGGGIIERGADARVYDTFLMTGPEGEVLSYRKQHPFYFERLFFHCGSRVGIFDTSLGRIGLMICWDMVHPRLVQSMAGQIDLLLIVSAWPDVSRGSIPLYGVRGWLSRQPAERPGKLAHHLGVPVAYCNMTGPFATRVPFLGISYKTEYCGSSSIVDESGKRLATVGDGESLLMADVKLPEPQRLRRAA